MSSTATRVAKNTGFLYAKMGITMFVSLYTTRLVLNALGASDYGVFNTVGGAIALLGFLNAALASSTQRFMSYSEGAGNLDRKKYIFNTSFILHSLLGLILFASLIIAGFIFFNGLLNIPEGRMQAAIIVYSSLIISTVFSVMSVPYEAVLNSHENMKYFAMVGIFDSLLKLAVAFICVYVLMDKLIVYGILMAIIPIVVLIVMRIYCHHHYEECIIAPKQYYDKTLVKDMTSFAGWGFISSVAAVGTMQGMGILLNVFGGVVVNAAHGIANQLSGMFLAFSNTMLKALNPVLVKSCGAGRIEQMLKASETGNKLSFFCFSIFAIPFIIETPYILSIWLKDVPQWAVLFCRLVFIRQMISQTYITIETCVSATGQIKNMSIVLTLLWAFPIVVGVILYNIGAPIYTIYILLVILAILRGASALYFCKKQCKLNVLSYILGTFLPMLATSFFVFCIGELISHTLEISLLRCIIVFILTVMSFVIVSFLMMFNNEEKKQIKSVLKALGANVFHFK